MDQTSSRTAELPVLLTSKRHVPPCTRVLASPGRISTRNCTSPLGVTAAGGVVMRTRAVGKLKLRVGGPLLMMACIGVVFPADVLRPMSQLPAPSYQPLSMIQGAALADV